MTEFSGGSSINHVSGTDAQSRFKAGDRVEYQNGIEEDPANGTLGTVLDGADPWTRVHVEWDSRFPLPSPGEYPLVRNLRPVKATPNVGDIVRVVLEGKVRQVTPSGVIGIEGWNFHPTLGNVKSIEIITPAKPSVADLPVGSVVRDSIDGEVYIKLGEREGKPWVSAWGARFTDGQVDTTSWTLLVEKDSE